jgi:hypothetical protein
MDRPLARLAIVAAFLMVAACAGPSPKLNGVTANVSAVHVTRSPGSLVMPPFDKVIVDQRAARRLANDILALPGVPSGTYACPADFGTTYHFAFSANRDWSADVAPFGCRMVTLSNGTGLWSETTPGFAADLASDLGIPLSEAAPMECYPAIEPHCYPDSHGGKGLLTGGIRPCQAILVPGRPHYVAGTVFVSKGTAPVPTGNTGGPSSAVIATQKVTDNQSFLLAIEPGDYIIQAELSPPANVRPYVAVTIKAGIATQADIPNTCM